MSDIKRVFASFKDPDAVVFVHNNLFYRQLNVGYQKHYDHFELSGLYQTLIENQLLIAHECVNEPVFDKRNHFKTILPEQLKFIQHPSEWSFQQ